MKKLTYFIKCILLLFILTMSPLNAAAVSPRPIDNLQIIELQTGTTASAKEEYLQFYNPGPDKNATGWALEYRSSKHDDQESGWTTKAEQTCTKDNCPLKIASQDLITIASTDYQPKDTRGVIYPNNSSPDSPKSLGFSGSGGQIRLISWTTDSKPADCQNNCTIEDEVSYGTGGDLAQTSSNGLIKRVRTTDNSGYQDTENDKNDFLSTSPDPTNDNSSNSEITTPPPDQEVQPPTPAESSVAKILITELLPDPASPLKDGENEFIEIYNPNDTAMNISGYTLQAGSNWRYKFSLPQTEIPAQGYVSFSSKDTNITLSNNGSSVRLLAPNSQIVDETLPYPKAKTGQSWALNQGNWDWTVENTPGNANVIKTEPQKVKANTPVGAKSTKTATTKASTKSVKQTASSPKATSKKSTASSPKTKNAASTMASASPSNLTQPINKPMNYWLLGAAGTLAGGYTVYEYRSNIARRTRQLYQSGKTKLGK